MKNVYNFRLARLISPMGSLWIYCKWFLRFLSDPDRLCCSPFWKSITASHILAGARCVARRATEARSGELKKVTREETCTTWLSSLWAASLGDGSEQDRKRKSNSYYLTIWLTTSNKKRQSAGRFVVFWWGKSRVDLPSPFIAPILNQLLLEHIYFVRHYRHHLLLCTANESAISKP